MVCLPFRRVFLAIFLFALTLPMSAFAGLGGVFVHQPVHEVSVDKPVVIETSFLVSVSSVELHYRLNNEAGFRTMDMRQALNGNYKAVLRDLALNAGDRIEYYITAETSTGQLVTEPAHDPESMPHTINVIRRTAFQEQGIEAVLLSPEPGATLSPSDFFVAISLFADTVDVKKLQLKLDGNDVTKQSDVTPELVTYSGKGIKEGDHEIRLWYAQDADNIILLAEAAFVVSQSGAEDIFSGKGFTQVASQSGEVGEKKSFEDGKFRANLRTEFKGQNNLGTTTNYKRAGGDLSYEQNWFKIGFTGDWDSEDNPAVNQPLSRYLVTANFSNMLLVDYGDAYPVFSPVTLYGTRVRGLSAAVNLGIFNFQFVQGQLNRAVISKEDKVNRGLATISLADTLDNDTASFTGTFQRDIIGGRISMGPGSAQIGISAFKAKDIQSSLKYNQLTNAALFEGTPPKENVVAGLDMKFSAWNKRINFDASVATGLTNEDITGGSIEKETLALSGIVISQGTIDMVSNFITFNTNLNPLPLGELDKQNLFAYTAGASINALNNNFSARYRYHGGYFQTYGASVARDLESFEISDRIRLWENRIFLTGSYAQSSNNLLGTNANTVETKNIGFQYAMFIPKLPTLTIGFNTIGRDNGFQYSQSTSKWEDEFAGTSKPEDNKTNILSVSTSYAQTLFDMRHNFSLSVATSNRKDNTKNILQAISGTDTVANYWIAYGDAKTTSFGFGITSEWKIPLRTNLTFSLTDGETEVLDSVSVDKAPTKSMTFGLSGDYRIMESKDQKLNVYSGFAITSYEIPSVDPATLLTFTLGSRFNMYERHTLYLDLSNTSGIEVQTFDVDGNLTGTKKESNRVITARYEFVF